MRRFELNRGVYVTCREVEGRAEFLLLTIWESEEAVRAFAGADPGKAVFYPEDERFLIDRDEHVDHYDVLRVAGVEETRDGRQQAGATDSKKG